MAVEAVHHDRIKVPHTTDFTDVVGLVVEYLPAPEIRELAMELIAKYPELAELDDYEINFLWRKEGGNRRGDAVLGNMSVTSGLTKYFTECDYVLWMAADHFREFQLSDHQIEAALFHQLCHAKIKDEKPTIRPHDIEGFRSELQRYGAWTSELKSAKDAFAQATLPIFGSVPFGSFS